MKPFSPMLLGRKAEPFDDPDCLYELKVDGFRSLAVVRDGDRQLISRNGNTFKTFDGLRTGLPSDLRVRSAVLDGEIACLDSSGRSVFDDLFFRRREPVFIALVGCLSGGAICKWATSPRLSQTHRTFHCGCAMHRTWLEALTNRTALVLLLSLRIGSSVLNMFGINVLN
ncbi:MAG TPA: hypothetical protein VN622_04240 [Clostridia bacterium]|nr:hypothetical protein [Clostridia bacterium]